MGCHICGRHPQIHHVTSDGYKRIARSHQLVVPLCFDHHKVEGGKLSIESMGPEKFHAYWGVNLYTLALRLWEEWSGGATGSQA